MKPYPNRSFLKSNHQNRHLSRSDHVAAPHLEAIPTCLTLPDKPAKNYPHQLLQPRLAPAALAKVADETVVAIDADVILEQGIDPDRLARRGDSRPLASAGRSS